MRILILGGDGYLGWPQSLYLSCKGHDVTIYDNFMHRHFDLECGFHSLIPIYSLQERIAAWKEVSGRQIQLCIGDTMDYEALASVFQVFQPEAVVHFAEQRSAPYSMIDRKHAVFTQANIVIEEGFIEVHHKGRSDILPFPKQPGSFYHLSKVHDSQNIMFCCKIWGLRATDLNQGIVYGVETDETTLDRRLATRFDYDQIYGTALNRFCVQATVQYPLTIYGNGQQIRGYINLRDTIRCIELSIASPPEVGEYRVFNQFTEQYSLVELAKTVVEHSKRFGLEVQIKHLPNPRVEAEQHYYNAEHTKLIDLGLEPHLLNGSVLESLMEYILKHHGKIDRSLIMPTINWRAMKNEVSRTDY